MTDFMTMKYNVDMVFCIDATGSMSPVLETVKQNALNFYDDVTKVMNEKQKSIDRLRIRVIAFRDYLADGTEQCLQPISLTFPLRQESLKPV